VTVLKDQIDFESLIVSNLKEQLACREDSHFLALCFLVLLYPLLLRYDLRCVLLPPQRVDLLARRLLRRHPRQLPLRHRLLHLRRPALLLLLLLLLLLRLLLLGVVSATATATATAAAAGGGGVVVRSAQRRGRCDGGDGGRGGAHGLDVLLLLRLLLLLLLFDHLLVMTAG